MGELAVVYLAPASRTTCNVERRGVYICDRKERPVSQPFPTFAEAEAAMRRMRGGRR
jgi:hypothetical protein